jgi:hypothetical protein
MTLLLETISSQRQLDNHDIQKTHGAAFRQILKFGDDLARELVALEFDEGILERTIKHCWSPCCET